MREPGDARWTYLGTANGQDYWEDANENVVRREGGHQHVVRATTEDILRKRVKKREPRRTLVS